MILTNPGWVGYFDRTYEQIKANVLTKFQSLVPEITDHTETNPWVKGISIWSALVELLGYYIDSNAREVYLSTAQEYSSAIKISKLFDYRVKGAVPSSVTVRFTSNIAATGAISIPIGTKIKTETGIIFTTTTAGTIALGQTFCDVQAKQWEAVNNVALGNSTGVANQEYTLEEFVVDGSVSVTVNAAPYTPQETFAFSVAANEHFVAGLGEDTKMRVAFGDNVNGKIPPSGQPIVASYYVTDGAGGNVGANKINQMISAITVPGSEVISVNNQLNASGGADYETLPKLQKRIPMSIRTKYRAVTPQDFIDIAEMIAGVERAGVQFDPATDVSVQVFIAPEGGGLASPTLITDTENIFAVRKIITTKISVRSAGLLEFIIQGTVNALPGFSNATVKADVEQALIDFFLPANQNIKGSVILGDLYEAIEEVRGVQNSNITLLLAVPFARNLVSANVNLSWTRAIKIGSVGAVRWLMRFITNSQYELFKENNYIGTFNVNSLVSLTEIDFTVNGNHTSGDNYEFYTYAYNQNVFLSEPSIPATSIGKLTINVTGGV